MNTLSCKTLIQHLHFVQMEFLNKGVTLAQLFSSITKLSSSFVEESFIQIFNFSFWLSNVTRSFMQIHRKLWGLSVRILDAELYKYREKFKTELKVNFN